MDSRYTVGIDPSLTGCGLARVFADGSYDYTLLQREDLRGRARLTELAMQVARYATSATFTLLEGPAYSRMNQAGHHELAGLWWMIVDRLSQANVLGAVAMPNLRALYATGAAGANKLHVHGAVCKRFTAFDEKDGDDEADALVLAAMAADHLGFAPVRMSVKNRTALEQVPWGAGLELPPTKAFLAAEAKKAAAAQKRAARKTAPKKVAPRKVKADPYAVALGSDDEELLIPFPEPVG